MFSFLITCIELIILFWKLLVWDKDLTELREEFTNTWSVLNMQSEKGYYILCIEITIADITTYTREPTACFEVS